MFGRRPPADPFKERMRKLSQPPAPATSNGSTKPVRAPRQAIFKNAALLFGDAHRLAVVIKDLNAQGARIEFFQKIELPDDVVLIEPMMKLRRAASIVWRRDGAAGLRFK